MNAPDDWGARMQPDPFDIPATRWAYSPLALTLKEPTMDDETKAQSQRPLPRYRCHKVVRAAKIHDVRRANAVDAGKALDSVDLVFSSLHPPHHVTVDAGWLDRKVSAARAGRDIEDVAVGGYYVVYDDGYTSWSPAKAFEEGYTLLAEDTDTATAPQRPDGALLVQAAAAARHASWEIRSLRTQRDRLQAQMEVLERMENIATGGRGLGKGLMSGEMHPDPVERLEDVAERLDHAARPR